MVVMSEPRRTTIAIPGKPLVALLLVLQAVFVGPSRIQAQTPPPEDLAFFEKKIRPLLVEQCYACHGNKKQKGSLRVDSLEGLLTGGDSGPSIVPGKPRESLLIKAIEYHDDLKMPPKKALSPAQINDLILWIQKGASWPGSGNPRIVARSEKEVTEADRSHWSFRPVTRPQVPRVIAGGNASPIDQFIVARQKAKGLTMSLPASPRELIRRVTFDLTGLPPTPAEVKAFVADPSDQAYEAVVDRLLASPGYGERWGRHWLDLVRYAQSNGYERDGEKPFAWRYRDYVIESWNADKPYDQFIREQIAGDEITPVTDSGKIATAFYHLGVWDDEPDNLKQADFDNLDDMISTASEAFLGVTLGCARCHDHKFDPFSQEDYYGLAGMLRGIKPARKMASEKESTTHLKLQNGDYTLAVQQETGKVPETFVLANGQESRRGKKVEPRFPVVLCPSRERSIPAIRLGDSATGRRTALAEWITARDNPLTARVMVNRLWHWHFGKGIVATPSDFGRQGAAPSHPELLDWLASELMDGGWKLKRIHRLIVLSRTYRQSSNHRADMAAIDPGNTYLCRQNLRRLEAEAIRDAVLATSGTLNRKMGDRGICPELPREVLETQSRPGNGWKVSPLQEQGRRSVYIFIKRTLGVPILDSFDFASPDKSVSSRTTTTIAPQALILLNSAFMDEQATALGRRLLAESKGTPADQISLLYQLAFQRQPTQKETEISLAYLDRCQTAALPALLSAGGALPRLNSSKSRGDTAAGKSKPAAQANLAIGMEKDQGKTANSGTGKPFRGSRKSGAGVKKEAVPAKPGEPGVGLVNLCKMVLNLNEFVYPD